MSESKVKRQTRPETGDSAGVNRRARKWWLEPNLESKVIARTQPQKMKIRASVACFVMICLQWSVTVSAHHATALQYNVSKTVRLKGVISKLDWANPHAHLHLDVKDARGNEEHWNVELGPPGAVIVSGLSRAALSPGITVTVVGYPGKAGPSGASEAPLCAKQVTLSDGTTAEVVGI